MKTEIRDRNNGNEQAIDNAGASLNIVRPLPPYSGVSGVQKMRLFRQYLTNNGDKAGNKDMRTKTTGSGVLGACSDHTAPTYTFTDAGGGFTGASAIQIISSGLGGNAILGYYPVALVNSNTSVELYRDPTNGNNETVIAWSVASNPGFYIQADANLDTYISVLSFVIADAGAGLNEFGGITALTNGCRLFYTDESGEVDIHDALKTNFDFIRLGIGDPAFGATTNAFIASNVSGTSEAVIPTIDLRKTFGFQWGILLRAGSNQRITLWVNDDTTAVDQFDCIAYGFTRAKD